MMAALRAGASVSEVSTATGIDPWFVDQLMLVKQVADELSEADEKTGESC